MSKCSFHSYFFLFIFISLVISTGVIFQRTIQFREVTCLNYIDCPNDIIQDFKITRSDPKCIYIKDYQNLITIGLLEMTTGQPNFEQRCWTDGLFVTTINQNTVMNIFVGSIFFILVFYIILCLIHNCKKRRQGLLSSEYQTYIQSYINESDLKNIKTVNDIFLTIVVFLYVISIIISCDLLITYREVTCTNYKQCSVNTDYKSYVNCVQYNDFSSNNHNSQNITYQIKSLGFYSQQMSNLPQSCWSNKIKVMFDSPKKILLYCFIFFICYLIFYTSIVCINRKLRKWMKCTQNPTIISVRRPLYNHPPYMQLQEI
jgi:hypothetical protein